MDDQIRRLHYSDEGICATITKIIQRACELSPEATACHHALLRFCQPGELISAMPLALCGKLVREQETMSDVSETASEPWTSDSAAAGHQPASNGYLTRNPEEGSALPAARQLNLDNALALARDEERRA